MLDWIESAEREISAAGQEEADGDVYYLNHRDAGRVKLNWAGSIIKTYT